MSETNPYIRKYTQKGVDILNTKNKVLEEDLAIVVDVPTGTIQGGVLSTFYVDGTKKIILSSASGEQIYSPQLPTKFGYRFGGWTADDQPVTFPLIPTADADYNASFYPGYKAAVIGLGSSSPSGVQFSVETGFSTTFEEVTKDGNVFIKIPTMWRKVLTTSDNQITGFEIATALMDSSYVPYSCFVSPQGAILPYILIGKYMSSSTTTCNSVNATYVTQTLATGRDNARSLGTGYQLYDWQIHKLFQDLCIVDKRTVNINSGTGFDSILGIYHQKNGFWIDGVAKSASDQWLFAYDPAKYANEPTASTSGYSTASYSAPTTNNSEVMKLGYDANHPFANFCSAVTTNSSYDTYYTDGYYYASGSRPFYCGVGNAVADYGAFSCNVLNVWPRAYGVRLCFRPVEA